MSIEKGDLVIIPHHGWMPAYALGMEPLPYVVVGDYYDYYFLAPTYRVMTGDGIKHVESRCDPTTARKRDVELYEKAYARMK